jgi:hypothetical protein
LISLRLCRFLGRVHTEDFQLAVRGDPQEGVGGRAFFFVGFEAGGWATLAAGAGAGASASAMPWVILVRAFFGGEEQNKPPDSLRLAVPPSSGAQPTPLPAASRFQ